MIHEGMSWDEYRDLAGINASTLVHGLRSMKQLRWALDHSVGPSEDTVRVGSAAHTIVEYLPRDVFDQHFVVAPDFARHSDNVDAKGNPSTSAGTTWARRAAREWAASEERDVLTQSEYKRLVRIVQSISEHEGAMDLIKHSRREVVVTGELCGVPCKGRVDGICGGFLWDLKTTADVMTWPFEKTVKRLHYLFRMAMYVMLLAKNGVEVDEIAYIAVEDCRMTSGGYFPRAPDVSVKSVPLVAVQNWMPKVEEVLESYKACQASGEWPGVGDDLLFVTDYPDHAMEG